MEKTMTIDIASMFATLPTAPAPQTVQAFAPMPQMQQPQMPNLNLAALLQGLHTAAPARVDTYFQAGDYIVSFQLIKGRPSEKGPIVIIEWLIEQSNNAQLPAGLRASHMIKLQGPRGTNENAMADLRGFVVAMCDLSEAKDKAQIDSEIMGLDAHGVSKVYTIISALEQGVPRFVGKRLWLHCKNIQTKAGNPFTKHLYAAVPT
jgi:hypothetical protein